MAETYFGEAAALSPRIKFDNTPLMRGFQLGQEAEARKGAAAAKKQEQLDKRKERFYNINPAKVHAWYKDDVTRRTDDYLGNYAMNPNVDEYDALRGFTFYNQDLRNYESASIPSFEYDKDDKRVKDPVISAAHQAGDHSTYDKRVKQLDQLGIMTDTLSPFGNAYAPKKNLPDIMGNLANFKDHSQDFVATKKETQSTGDIAVTYQVSPQRAYEIAAQAYDRPSDLPNLVFGQYSSLYQKNYDKVASDPNFKGANPQQVADEAAIQTLAELIPSHRETYRPREANNITINNVPQDKRTLFTDLAVNTKADIDAITSAPPAGYFDFIKRMAGVFNGRVVDNLVDIRVPANELNKAVLLDTTDQVYNKENRPIVLASPMAVKGQRISLGYAEVLDNGSFNLITPENYNQHKGNLTSGSYKPVFIVDYDFAQPVGDKDASPIKSISTADYNRYANYAKSEINRPTFGTPQNFTYPGSRPQGKTGARQIFIADEIGSSILNERYPISTGAYGKTVGGIYDKTGTARTSTMNEQAKPRQQSGTQAKPTNFNTTNTKDVTVPKGKKKKLY